jgi:four helix bundle protein
MENLAYQDFTELEVWKKARILKNDIWKLAKTFPLEEKYRLLDQIVRSSRSVLSLIAEGHGRFTYKEQINYCVQARGSLSETYNHLIESLDCDYVTEEQLEKFRIQIEEVRGLLNGYISYLRRNL